MKMSQMLAAGKDSPSRADKVLDPGVNRFVVTDAAGQLTVTRADEASQAPAKR
jgi:hypothetical protein